MPYASIYPTDPRINPWNFGKKILRIGGVEKLSFFESAILEFFFGIFFTSSPWEWVGVSWLARMSRNFDDYPGFQPETAPA